MERDINALHSRIRTIEDKMAELREAIVEHRTRLQNGVKVFGTHHDRLETIEKKIEPKPPSVYKIVGITISVVLAGAGALWGLANMLRDRPTVDQLDKVLHGHDQNGHRDMKDDIRAVQIEQGAQRTLIEDVQLEQKEQGRKLDTLIQRTPAPPEAREARERRSH